MTDELDWVMRPVIRGLCSYESLMESGSINLVDISRMNEALDVADENQRKYDEYIRAKIARR